MSHQWALWPNCVFCNSFIKLNKGDETSFFEEYTSLRGRQPILDETENLVLVPDIAPLLEDHLLLIPKLHIPSFAMLSETHLPEAEAFLGQALQRMCELHPAEELFAFEHGVGYVDGQVIQCGACNRTDHAHLHLLPLPRTDNHGVAEVLRERIKREFPVKIRVAPSLPSLSWKRETGHYPYLLFWSSLGSQKTHLLIQDSLEYEIPSQVTRKLLAFQTLGISENDAHLWDWRNLITLYHSKMEGLVRNTIDKWHNH